MPDPLPDPASRPASEPTPAVVVETHLAAGGGWLLSRGRSAGEQVLLVFEETDDLVSLRRRLAVAGSIGGPHLPAVLDVAASDSGRVVVTLAAPGGPNPSQLATAHGALAAGAIATLVAPLATTLATLHSRGLELADVTAATVWLTGDGRPLLVPVGLADVNEGRHGPHRNVAALAAVALDMLDRASPGADAVGASLQAAVDGTLDAAALGSAVLRCVEPMPIGETSARTARRPHAASRHGHGPGASARHRAPRAARQRQPVLVVGVVVVAAIVLGTLWGRHDSGAALAALPRTTLVPLAPAKPTRADDAPVPAPISWRRVVTLLERKRARAYRTGDVGLLATAYASGSPTGRRDLAVLRGLVGAGQRAAGLQAFVEAVDVVAATDSRTILRVSDALTAYDVVSKDGHVHRRGAGRPTRQWTITLLRTTTGWRIWSVGL